MYEKFEANLEAAKGDDAKTHALCEGLFNAIDAYADGNISKDELIAFEVSKGVDHAKQTGHTDFRQLWFYLSF